MKDLRGLRLCPPLLVVLLAFLPLLAGCSSPNRGVWAGTFDGSVAGTVEFRINTRGTRLTGSLTGATRDGNPFHAEMEGKIEDQYFYATFEGKSLAGGLPVAFDGFLRGELQEGKASGDWSCTLRLAQRKLSGAWHADQVAME